MGRTRGYEGGSGCGPDGERAPILNLRLERLSERIRAEIDAMGVEQKDRAFLATSHGTNYLTDYPAKAVSGFGKTERGNLKT